MDTKLNEKQRMARTAMLFDLKEPITPEENAALDLPYWEWPQSLKEKAGEMGRLVENEDRMAKDAAPSPAK